MKENSLKKFHIVNLTARHFNKLIILLNSLFILLFLIYHFYEKSKEWLAFLFEGYIPNFLLSNSSNLISLSAIFLGIYFTIFTLISTLNLNSSLAKLNEDSFNHIVKSIRNGFITTFMYVIFLLFVNSHLDTLKNPETFLQSLVNLANFLFCTTILLAALNIAILLYAAYKVDIEKLPQLKQIAERDAQQAKLLMSDVERHINFSEDQLIKIHSKIKSIEEKQEK